MPATTTSGRVLTTADAEKDIASFKKEWNSVGFITPYSQRLLRDMKEKVQIVSVSPWGHTMSMGSWGSYHIPACPDDKPFVYFQMNDIDGVLGGVPGVMAQRYRGDGVMPIHEEDGREWAQKLCNNDFGLPSYLSLNRQGIAVIEGQEPTEAELKVLRSELRVYCMYKVQEADDWWNDPKRRSDISDNPHHMAARVLKIERPWTALNSQLEGGDRQKCQICGHYSDAGVLKCGNCKEFIFDLEKYKAVKAGQKVA